jgi:hypothetical protein
LGFPSVFFRVSARSLTNATLLPMKKESAATQQHEQQPPKKNKGGGGGGGRMVTSSVFQLVDAIVELYLGSVVQPFVKVHEKFYAALNVVLRKALDDNARSIPPWFTANFITYLRTALVLPTLLLLAWECNVATSIVVLAVDFGDFLDGVVARFWVDEKKKGPPASEAAASSKKKGGEASPTNSDDESFGTRSMT